MAEYQAPEGYLYDPETGLYYSQVTAVDARGSRMQVVTWFHADTGEYEQQVYPVIADGKPQKTGKVSGPELWKLSKRLLLIPVAALAVVIVIAMVCVLAAGLGSVSDSVGGIEEYGELVVTRDIPSGTICPSEYEGTLREEGIIR
ncbi:MAG: hypothetical protein K5985_11625 [Lachnospiraceae bacterium]|nr:hypothetical protein [Lachnospiraceae bacterium]